MNRELRWRILTLQIIVTLILGFCAGVGFWAHNFTHDQVSSQLTAQNISFPPANSAAIKSLPAVNASAMNQYGGQQMTTGDQAKTYAENFIAVHLNAIGQGKTYSYWSGIAINPATSKAAAVKAEGIALTLFRGETLRSLLLNAWAFWFVGTLALYAATALTIAGGAVFFAFLFELGLIPRRERIGKKIQSTRGAAIPVS